MRRSTHGCRQHRAGPDEALGRQSSSPFPASEDSTPGTFELQPDDPHSDGSTQRRTLWRDGRPRTQRLLSVHPSRTIEVADSPHRLHGGAALKLLHHEVAAQEVRHVDVGHVRAPRSVPQHAAVAVHDVCDLRLSVASEGATPGLWPRRLSPSPRPSPTSSRKARPQGRGGTAAT